jgi:hypothetical protein
MLCALKRCHTNVVSPLNSFETNFLTDIFVNYITQNCNISFKYLNIFCTNILAYLMNRKDKLTYSSI